MALLREANATPPHVLFGHHSNETLILGSVHRDRIDFGSLGQGETLEA